MTIALSFIFFLSGAAALIFEILWFQLAGLTFGNTVWSTAIVLSSFMGGLAIGNCIAAYWGHRIRQPLQIYALIETLVAMAGLGLVLGLPVMTQFMTPMFKQLTDYPLVLNGLRGVTAFSLMLIPATAMGMTLPVVVKALYHTDPRFGRVLGLLYGWNTLGATAGVMAAELWLVDWFGLKGAGMFAAVCNVSAALIAFRLAVRSRSTSPPLAVPPDLNRGRIIQWPSLRLLLVGLLAGFVLLSLEVVWFRFLIIFYTAHSLNYAIMLSVVLLGISLGGLVASWIYKVHAAADRHLVILLVLNCILIVGSYRFLIQLFHLIQGQSEAFQLLVASLFLMLPVSLVSGVIFTMVGNRLHSVLVSETGSTGLLTLANTTGGMLGSLAAALVFIPGIGIEPTFYLMACTYLLAAFLLWDREIRTQKTRLATVAVSMALAVIMLAQFPFGQMRSQYVQMVYPWFLQAKGERRIAYKESLTETIQYLQKDVLGQPHYHRLATNSHSMSATYYKNRRYMKLYAYLPAALNPDLKKALLISYGCGSTAKALKDNPSIETIDVVDISRDIVDMSQIIFPALTDFPPGDPRVRVHIEDGRFFLLTTGEYYDLITAEPPPPKVSGIVNLYTQEFFELVFSRLAPGGIASYWLPVVQLETNEAKAILHAFSNAFDHTSLWTGSGMQWMMVGIKKPLQAPEPSAFARQWRDPVNGPELRALGFQDPETFGALFIADGQRLKDWIGSVPPLTDNYPRRLSYPRHRREEHIPSFLDFMKPEPSRIAFHQSDFMRSYWPRTYFETALDHFERQHVINRIILHEPAFPDLVTLQLLNDCLHDNRLKVFIPWLFQSDADAQEIIARARDDRTLSSAASPEIYMHLAARETQAGNYQKAIEYLDQVTHDAKASIYTKTAFFVRIHLLYAAGQPNQARAAAQDYVERGPGRREHRAVEIKTCTAWLEARYG